MYSVMLYLFCIVLGIFGVVLSCAGFCDAWLLFLPLVVVGFVCDVMEAIRERKKRDWRYKGDL